MKRLYIIGFMTVIAATIYSCSNDKYDKLYPVTQTPVTVTCDTSNISYATDIVPIVTNNCYSSGNGCHDVAGSATSGYNFTTYYGIVSIAQSGALLADLNWEPGHNQMPKNGNKLSACDIDKFTRWVNQGAPNN